MPGMMDTILNLGLNDDAVEGLAGATGNERFAYDSYRRLIQMYGEVVDGVDAHRFEQALADLKARRGAATTSTSPPTTWPELDRDASSGSTRGRSGRAVPQDAASSCGAPSGRSSTRGTRRARRSTGAPTRSRTTSARRSTSGRWSSATRARLGTGVCFTRDPSTGEAGLYGEFLVNAQGEDVVAGIRTPEPIARMRRAAAGGLRAADGDDRPARGALPRHAGHRVHGRGRHGSTSCRRGRGSARRRPPSRIAVDMVDEGLISTRGGGGADRPGAARPAPAPDDRPGGAPVEVAAKGLNASPGAASGAIVLDADTAEERGKAGEDVILVRWETTPDDIHGLIQAREGVLTAHGGMTSHAAVVARGMGKPCVAGLRGPRDRRRGAHGRRSAGHTLREGDVITIDGGTGRVIIGPVDLVPPTINEDFETILEWADDLRRLRRARERRHAGGRRQGARVRRRGHRPLPHRAHVHGGGAAARRARDDPGRRARRSGARRSTSCCRCSRPTSRGIFEAMAGLPVTIRLLDPPLHEFLPPLEEATDERCASGSSALHEANPMLGTRGCRLGLQYPEIYEMQVRAIVRAARRSRSARARRRSSRSCTRSSASPRSCGACAS